MEKIDIVLRNTKDVMTREELENSLGKNLTAYYGTAPTGPFHIAYLIPLSKVFDFGLVGIKTKILIADLHAALDDLKTKWDQIELKREYYKKCIELSLPWKERPEIIYGSSYQTREDYVKDVLKLSTLITVKRALRAASEVTRMKNPKVSELIYPIMQALDEEYLNVDIQLGGIDQRHIMAFAREYLPLLGYRKRIEIMTPLVASLLGPGTKMSASLPNTHIKIYDSEENIKQKIKKAYCPVGIVEDNPILQLYRFLVFPIVGKIKIERPEKFGGDLEFNSYDEMEKIFLDKKIHPLDLKNDLSKRLIELFKKPREYFSSNKDILEELGENFKI